MAVPSVADDGEPAADELLDNDDSASVEARGVNASAAPAVLVSAAAAGQQTSPVALTTHLPALPGAQASKPSSELATKFMQWLQAGLASRGITYNETGAPVHFVPAGMALVSPLIFREFARQHPAEEVADTAPERLGLDVQREVLKAGWHVPAPGGKTSTTSLSSSVAGSGQGGFPLWYWPSRTAGWFQFLRPIRRSLPRKQRRPTGVHLRSCIVRRHSAAETAAALETIAPLEQWNIQWDDSAREWVTADL